MQVLFGALLIGALHAALANAEIAFDSVGMDWSATPFARSVADEIVISKFLAKTTVLTSLVDIDRCLSGNIFKIGANVFALRSSTTIDLPRPVLRSTRARTLCLGA